MARILFKNASEVVTPQGVTLQKGAKMADLLVIPGGFVLTKDGTIEAVGDAKALESVDVTDCQVIDCTGKTILPGLVDSHTHFIFGGYRENEFNWRLNGESYVSIMERGGGISATTTATRATDLDEFLALGRKRLASFASHGVTTVEGKSGYGLDLETELRQLEAMARLNQEHHIRIVPTYMGAHDLPPEFKGRPDEYIDFCIREVMPKVRAKDLAVFCDIFTERGVFDLAQTRRYLEAAREMGFGLRMHADELFEGFGGAELAGALKTSSADHLLKISEAGIAALEQGGVCATLLPLTAFSIKADYAPARRMIDAGVGVALATDMNPGSCYSESMPLLIALSTIYMGMRMEEVVTALTLNGAAALNLAEETGSLEVGKRADVAVFDVPNHRFLTYHFGVNECVLTMSGGRIVHQRPGAF
ncbi:Imidazolonepropionase [Clostridiaceae bacterium JG1575]|nr:Imidazolonepropionase [Clostridiaceae bacterium JG1575]